MGFFLLIAALVAGAAMLGGSGRGIQGGAVQYIPPRPKVIEGLYVAPKPGEPGGGTPKRIAVPELKWHSLKGQVRIPSIAKQPRFPAAKPGYETVELAVLMRTNESVRILVDVRIVDATIPVSPPLSAASAVKFWHDANTQDKPQGSLESGPTEWAERLVRQFQDQHGKLVGSKDYDAAVTLPHQLPRTPMVPLYVGEKCDAQATVDLKAWMKIPEPFIQLGVQIGLAIQEAAGRLEPRGVLFDHEDCMPVETMSAYGLREATDNTGMYPRMYNLRLQARGDAIVLTAEIARLPIVQVLDWEAFFALTPGGRFE